MGDAQSYYRHLHKIPEGSGSEFLTSRFIAQCLSSFGYEPQCAGATTVYADLKTEDSLPWILLRADMDALPVAEQSGLPFSSEHPGWMHACGHDAHCAMLLEAAGTLFGRRLPHNIRFVFQSAEETTQGAIEAIQQGIVPENVIACFAFHVWPGIPMGVPATKNGALMASSDVYRVKIKGLSAHCAQRDKGADALQAAVHIVSKLPEIRACSSDPKTLLFCGSIHSGTSHNIVPEEASLYGTLRTFSAEDRECIIRRLRGAVEDAAIFYGTQATIEWEGGCPAVMNDPQLVRILEDVIPDVFHQGEATLAGEDFAYFQRYAPGVMLWLGTGDTPPLHNGKFYVPEEVLPIGVSIWLDIAGFDWKQALDAS